MRNAIAAIAALGVVVLVGATWWFTRPSSDDPFAQCRETQIGTGVASIGGPLSLIDENGQQVTEAEMFTKPTLLYFGYTFCPDVCPQDNARNAEALDILLNDGYDMQMSFISVDPERDDPERLRDFTDYLHPQALGYTGTMEQIQAASRAYKTYFKKEENPDPDFYLIDHSTFTYLVLPETGFVEFFKRDTLPQNMADRVKCFIDNAN
ncbi:SCO family protein [Sinisalibacter aestuarii]|uniref:Protein senC n=1 Tax=Sinisalibacter aestuarii TaxID=2949426 RepID=A0ABQ5LNA2_9RHOB|nr:SCO family protein [Sinisalibacter aestuarii]GKY86487.1 protein senC [Sinisalibacter aestuarii]